MYKRYILPGICSFIAIFILLGSNDTRTRKASFFSKTLFYPFSQSLNNIKSISELRADIESLQRQLTIQKLYNLRMQNQLRMLENTTALYFETGDMDFVIGEVTGYSGNFNERNLIINKGKKDKVELDSPVVSATGIVGKTVMVEDLYSIVLPLTHSQFQLAVMDKTTGVQGILQSETNGNTYMNMIRLGSQISVGDTIVTSNLSRLFPKGYPVGKVIKIKESQDNLFISTQISPFTIIENLEHVFILKKEAKQNE